MDAVWADYVAWDYKDSTKLCKSLKSRQRRLTKLPVPSPLETVGLSTQPNKGPTFLCQEYDHSTQHCMSRDTYASLPGDDIVKNHHPHPPYSTCTPISQNIAEVGDLFLMGEGWNKDTDSKLAFIPFSDDEKFDANDYSGQFVEFGWQTQNEPSGRGRVHTSTTC